MWRFFKGGVKFQNHTTREATEGTLLPSVAQAHEWSVELTYPS